MEAVEGIIQKLCDEFGVQTFIKSGDRLESGPVALEDLTHEFFNDGLAHTIGFSPRGPPDRTVHAL